MDAASPAMHRAAHPKNFPNVSHIEKTVAVNVLSQFQMFFTLLRLPTSNPFPLSRENGTIKGELFKLPTTKPNNLPASVPILASIPYATFSREQFFHPRSGPLF